MSAAMRKGSRDHYIAWLASNAFVISWQIRKGAERFAAKWGLVVPEGQTNPLGLEVAECRSEPTGTYVSLATVTVVV